MPTTFSRHLHLAHGPVMHLRCCQLRLSGEEGRRTFAEPLLSYGRGGRERYEGATVLPAGLWVKAADVRMNKIRRDLLILICRLPASTLSATQVSATDLDIGELPGQPPSPSPAAWSPTPRTGQSLSACWSVGAGSATRSDVEIRPLSKYNALIPA